MLVDVQLARMLRAVRASDISGTVAAAKFCFHPLVSPAAFYFGSPSEQDPHQRKAERVR